MIGGASNQYRDLYAKSVAAMKKHIFYRPQTKAELDILIPGDLNAAGKSSSGKLETEPRAQHLGCFAGGMVGLASRAFSLPDDLDIARKLVEGCLWAYEDSPSGIMPEVFHTMKCPAQGACKWDEEKWLAAMADDVNKRYAKSRFAPGMTRVDDKRYILRPEAIESVFILYRLTGDRALMDRAWSMFEAIVRYTKTNVAHAALKDVTAEDPRKTQMDSMESFFLAETLKYFYLIFDSPSEVSLDEWVLNTEAHPFRWR